MNCRRLVHGQTETDRRALEHLKAAYASGRLELKDLRVERNGNGRDFDLVPTFGGTGKGSYLLTIEILPGNSRSPVPVYSAGHYVEPDANLRLYVTGAEIRRRLPDFVPGGRYTVRTTMTLSVPSRPPDFWRDPRAAISRNGKRSSQPTNPDLRSPAISPPVHIEKVVRLWISILAISTRATTSVTRIRRAANALATPIRRIAVSRSSRTDWFVHACRGVDPARLMVRSTDSADAPESCYLARSG